MSFITLDDARTELRIFDTQQDDYITKLIERTDVVLLNYLDFETVDAFYYEVGAETPKALSAEVAAAMVVRNLYDKGDEDPLTENIKSVLRAARAPRVG